MQRNEYSFEVTLTFDRPVTDHTFLLRCLPVRSPSQVVLQEDLRLDPDVHVTESTDGFGNRCVSGTILSSHDHFTYRSSGIVEIQNSERRPVSYAEKMVYAGYGELTQPDSRLAAAADGLSLIAGGLTDGQKADLLVGEVQNRMIYEPGITTTHTSAAEALELGHGVCQDFVHVYIALARQLGMTARYCMGLASEEGETHAWVEVLLEDGWHGYDPTRGCAAGENYIMMACGRDASDCPAEIGAMNGYASQEQMVQTSVTPVIIQQEPQDRKRHQQQKQQVQQ